MSNLWLTVEVAPGAGIERTCDDAVALAEKTGLSIWFKFNGVKCLAQAGDDPRRIEESWDAARSLPPGPGRIASDNGERPNGPHEGPARASCAGHLDAVVGAHGTTEKEDMGRELKRVPLNFEWPMNKPWEGYVNPHYAKSHDCAACAGSGSSPEARRLKDQWYGNAPFRPEDRGSTPFTPEHQAVRAFAERNVARAPEYYGGGEAAILREARRLAGHFNRRWSHHLNADDVAALIEGGRLMDLTHTWTPEARWQPKEPAYVPTPEEVNVWSLSGMGHDAINQWIVVGAECKRLGIDPECKHCGGNGTIWDSPEDEQAAEDWKRSEPPAGDGYQIWETVSEGSPISPVFATPEELARHMAGTQWGADKGTSYETWLRFITGPGWAPSFIVDASGVHEGVEAVCSNAPHEGNAGAPQARREP